jgi:hypothetical protein
MTKPVLGSTGGLNTLRNRLLCVLRGHDRPNEPSATVIGLEAFICCRCNDVACIRDTVSGQYFPDSRAWLRYENRNLPKVPFSIALRAPVRSDRQVATSSDRPPNRE